MFYYFLFMFVIVITYHKLTFTKGSNLLRKLYDYNYINYLLNKPNENILRTIPEYYKTRGGLVWSDEKQQYIRTPQRLNDRWYKDSYKIYGK